jgi:histidinol-phosphate aminotransferase
VTKFNSTYDPGVQVDDDDVLSLHRNENLFVGTEWTLDAARAMVEKAAISTYPDATSRPLREALAELYGVEPGNVFVGNGSDEVLADLLGLLRRNHDSVSCLDVCFKVYPMLLERMGFESKSLPGKSFETGHIDSADFHGIALVDSPNGITGRSQPREELLRLADEEDSFLIWDNVYGEYAGDDLPPLQSNLAIVRSFSKFYALAGLRVGYCIADEAVVSELLARKDAFNVNSFGQVMALEALRRRDEFQAQRDRLVECRESLAVRLEELGFDVPRTDFVALLATHPDHGAQFIQDELLKRKVAVRRFADPEVAEFVRITVAPAAQAERLLTALAEITGR